MKKIKILILLTISVFTISCSDDDSKEGVKDVNYTDIINKKFMLVSAVSELPLDTNNDGNFDRDIYAQMLKCEVDNIFEFYDNERIVIDENSNVCEDSQKTIIGKWNKNGTTGLLIYDNTGKEIYNFLDMVFKKENNKMVIYYYRYWNVNNNIVKVEYKMLQQ